MSFNTFNTTKKTFNRANLFVGGSASVVSFKSILVSALLFSSIGAHAMLPTPEPELNNTNNVVSSQIINSNDLAAKVETKTVAALVSVDSQGLKTLKPVDSNTRLKKGNVIEYHSYFTNKSSDRIRKMNVYMSIPDEVKLLGDVAPDTASASVNGQNFNRMPLRGRINGELKDIPLEYYKQLRWTIEGLGVNDTAVVKYRALVR